MYHKNLIQFTCTLILIIFVLCLVSCNQKSNLYTVEGTSIFNGSNFEFNLESRTYDVETNILSYNFTYLNSSDTPDDINISVESFVFNYSNEMLGIGETYENCNPNLNANDYVVYKIDESIVYINSYEFNAESYTSFSICIALDEIEELFEEFELQTDTIINNDNCLRICIKGYNIIFGDHQLIL